MGKSDIEELKQIVLEQGKQIKALSKKVKVLESRNLEVEPEKKRYRDEDFKPKKGASKDYIDNIVKKGKEDPTNMFKVFGVVGVLMIVMGVIYFYKYAVDQGWIGITGRVVLGVAAAIILIIAGIVMYYRKYVNYSQVLIAAGLGVMYFTIFATYHFDNYRQALGMNLTLNTILLLIVMIAGMLIGIRLDTRFVVYGSSGLGYLAAFLSGIKGDTLHILIYVLIINIILLIIARLKSWYIGIPAQVLTYVAYAIWFLQGLWDPQSIINQTSSPFLLTFAFLFMYYIIFTILSFIQSSDKKEIEAIVISIINTVCLSGFGLGLINKYYPEFNGLYILMIAGVALLVGFLSKMAKFENLFDIQFVSTLVLVAIAIPVQFDKTIVTVLWVAMALGLAYGGLMMHHERLFYCGYVGFIVPILRVLFYDFWYLDGIERWLAVGATIAGLLVIQLMIATKFSMKKAGEDNIYNLFSFAGIVLVAIWILVEIFDINTTSQIKNVSLSIAWALYAIVMITYGIAVKRKLFNWCGVALFAIVVGKVVIVDISNMQNIYRVVALIIVGVLALVGSFLFVRNREKINEFVQ